MRLPMIFAVCAGLGVISPAYALDPGECGTPEAMTAKLKAEGQRSVASANQWESQSKVENGLIVTMNATRSAGYILQSDQPIGVRATKLCVFEMLAGLRVFDARKTGLKYEALLKATDDDALRYCNLIAKKTSIRREKCFPFNAYVKREESHGIRPMFQGFIAQKAKDGSFQPTWALVTVMGRVGVGGAVVRSELPEGASLYMAFIEDVDYTPYGLSLLEKQ